MIALRAVEGLLNFILVPGIILLLVFSCYYAPC